ncbi:citrate synthase [Pusillimonas noertemannii]|uniref:citrate synthase (unknown stereospecificity) n=1 Tax=Pusillimonas noertemannii TaxID=305977 RepID=A0A2U1CNK8_9BURK|nr:citrate synthase [Pusillimonas noertemannii]NYT68392.1 helix-turn-helix domain-containing protein [Pusillimonas noertemannii]PVY62592.1 citrate synthase [Pusillimonas noertemannii]TFL10461.1 helix-turn-helix domain-containing protein [Pusillimonas noertemannii]
MENPDYLTRDEAARALGVKPATLYAYVSRGLLRRAKDHARRRSMYLREDVERLKARHPGPPVKAETASRALRWGEPVVNTNITYIDSTGPFYRNRKASELADSGISFETVVHLLLAGVWQPGIEAWPELETPAYCQKALALGMKGVESDDVSKVLARAILALGMSGGGARELAGNRVQAERLIIQTLAGCLGYFSPAKRFVHRRANEPIAVQVLRAAACEPTEDNRSAVNQALVLLADHELASASFASRIAASTNSDLFSCVAAALCVHAGSSTVAATTAVDERLFEPLSRRNWSEMQRFAAQRGTSLFGFNHPLYPKGDPRAEYLLRLASKLKPMDPKVPMLLEFLAQAKAESSVLPGIAVALVILARSVGMPRDGASVLWILSRSVGWMAHALEQRTQGFMLRPRARYVGGEPGAL